MATNYVESKELYEYIKENKELKDFFDLISVVHLKVTENKYADYVNEQISLSNKLNEKYSQLQQIKNSMPQFSSNSKLNFCYLETTIKHHFEWAKKNDQPLDYFGLFYQCVTSLFQKEDIEYMRQYILENESSNAEIKLESPAEKEYLEFSSNKKQLKKVKKSSKRKRRFWVHFNDLDITIPEKLDDKIESIVTKARKEENEVTDELSKEAWLTERYDFFQSIDFQKVKNIVDSYDLFCTTVNNYCDISKNLDEVSTEFELYKKNSWLNVIDLIIDSDSISQEQYKNITFELFKFFASDNKISDDFKREDLITSFNTLAVHYFLEFKMEDIINSFDEVNLSNINFSKFKYKQYKKKI